MIGVCFAFPIEKLFRHNRTIVSIYLCDIHIVIKRLRLFRLGRLFLCDAQTKALVILGARKKVALNTNNEYPRCSGATVNVKLDPSKLLSKHKGWVVAEILEKTMNIPRDRKDY